EGLLRHEELPHKEGAMLIGMVSRLSSQKGFDLVLQSAERLVEMNVQLIVQGLGDEHLVSEFQLLERQYPEHFKLFNVFDADLAQRVYAGSDAFLMPSSFEPCGLGQLIAFRYGTVPIVRATGGLKDTVTDGETGFVFTQRNPTDFLDAVSRARAVFGTSGWSELVANGMSVHSGWEDRADEYIRLFELACAKNAHIMM
ncbi:MAG TPA: glycosyltransferase, partial [Fimbriimonas sp.]|nr:glycosyltransferase [Fimbriimonas sp.]